MRVDKAKPPINWIRVLALVAAIAVSIAAGAYLQPLVSKNDDAINAVVTIFSILAGFLVAVITFIADPGTADWRRLQLGKRDVQAKLQVHKMLFYLYLFTLGFAFTLFIVPDTKAYAGLSLWLERIFVGLSVFVFLASFTLPSSLMKLQMRRYQEALDRQLPLALQDPSKAPCSHEQSGHGSE